ncbi:MAG: sensor histidine kinase [Candidatus Binatia bacterium]
MEPVNILLVDDSRNLESLDSILARPDYHVVGAPTANEALLALANHDFAVIVLDIGAPVADRFELAGLIKACKCIRHIPVIFLTAGYEDDGLALDYGSGAVDYLSKPVNPLVLRSKVAIFVELYRKTRELASLNQAMETEIARRLEQMGATLREKETLLQETHHRVKNNLQVISSLLNLQADSLADGGDARRLFLDARDRVRSMALVHEKFYQSHNLVRIELGDYLNSLMKELLRAHVGLAQTVRFRIEQQEVFLPVDLAIPCGLIVNELATNALKHAFLGCAGGEIAIALRLLDDQRICIVIGDDGSGLPQGLDWSSSDSFGLRLVRMLTEQLNGNLDLRDGPGTVFQLTFKAAAAEPLGEAVGR